MACGNCGGKWSDSWFPGEPSQTRAAPLITGSETADRSAYPRDNRFLGDHRDSKIPGRRDDRGAEFDGGRAGSGRRSRQAAGDCDALHHPVHGRQTRRLLALDRRRTARAWARESMNPARPGVRAGFERQGRRGRHAGERSRSAASRRRATPAKPSPSRAARRAGRARWTRAARPTRRRRSTPRRAGPSTRRRGCSSALLASPDTRSRCCPAARRAPRS